MPSIRGVIFDLDGTLADSGLDFAAMRREMGLPAGEPILEGIERLDSQNAARCRDILARHEWAGVERATVTDGAIEFIGELAARDIRRAVLTRNSRELALATIGRLALDIPLVLGREDAPVKPRPDAVLEICRRWALAPREVAVIGDYRFDIEAGRAAGAWTVAYTGLRPTAEVPWAAEADHVLECFTRAQALLAWMIGSDE